MIAIVTTAAAAAVAVYGVSHLRKPSPDQAGGFQSMQIRRLTSRGDIQTAALSPDGRYLAQVRFNQGMYSLWVQQVATESEVAIVTEQENEIRGVSFSPDGDYLYYLARDPEHISSTLFQVPSLGRTPRKILWDVDTGVRFSPDERALTGGIRKP